MATVAPAPPILRIGPADHGRRLALDEFIEAEFQEGWLYELARGVVEATEVPGPWHGRIVHRFARVFIHYDEQHPGRITYQAGAGECRMRLPGMVSDRHPDLAIYLDPEPAGPKVWTKWVPHIVVEVVSPGSQQRDFVDKATGRWNRTQGPGFPTHFSRGQQCRGCGISCRSPKREESLRMSVREYGILDPEHRRMHALVRAGDTWEETIVPEDGVYRTGLLPGLEVRPAEVLGPAAP